MSKKKKVKKKKIRTKAEIYEDILMKNLLAQSLGYYLDRNNDVDLAIEYLIKNNSKNEIEAVTFAKNFRSQVIKINGVEKLATRGMIFRKDDCLMEYIFDQKNKIAVARLRDFFKVKGLKAAEDIQEILEKLAESTENFIKYDKNKYECKYLFRVENNDVIVESIFKYKDRFNAKLFFDRGDELMESMRKAIFMMSLLNGTSDNK